MASEKTTRQRILNILRIAVVAALVLAVALNFKRFRNLNEGDIAALTEGAANLALAVAAVLGLYCVKGFLFVIPAMLLYVSVGAAFHPLWLALAVNAGGILLELALTYGMGAFLGGQQVNRLLAGNKGGRKLLELQNKRGFAMLFTARFVPAFPIDFTGLYFGAARIPFWQYLAASALGLLPRVALFTIFGKAARRFFPPKLLLAAAAVGLLAAGIAILLKKLKKRKSQKNS
jgi:uncharacterized membrane protein YdjX (TVP38/TMEM64 family)